MAVGECGRTEPVLSTIGTKVDSLTTKVTQLDSRVNQHHQEVTFLIKTLERKLKEALATPPTSYFQIDLYRKEEEIRKLKS